jgi:hypothetical protein
LVVAVVVPLHFLATYIAISVSGPGGDAPPTNLSAVAWVRVLGFPLVTIHDAMYGGYGPVNYGFRRLAVQFWVGGNSYLWGAVIYFGVSRVLRLLRDRQ